jgi:mono/diheme cytochrome c family protein
MSLNAYLQKFSALAIAGSFILLVGCSKQEITLKGSQDTLAERSVTTNNQTVVYPDANPSIPDGQAVYEKMDCASCHGETGKAVPGKCSIDLSDKEFMHQQKPVDQFEFLAFGKPGSNHPSLNDKLSRRQIWNLVFYTRSLASPLLSDKEWMDIDAVFGSNCAVCHGKKGYGDGPLAHNLEPQPANFQNFVRFYDRTDDILWDHIANGIKWEGMPNFLGKEDRAKGVKFDREYIWNLVQYVRSFHETNQSTIAQETGATDSPLKKGSN